MTVPNAGNLSLDAGDLEPGGGQSGGDSAGLAKLMAQKIAAAVVNPAPGEEGASLQPEVDTSTIVIEPTPEEKAAQEAAATAAAQQAAEAAAAGETPAETVPIEEIEGALAEAGIDLGISAKDVPKELMPVYERIVESAVDVAQSILSRELAASDAQRQIQDFGKRLQDHPDQLMLALAVNQPEVFKKVAELIGEMNTDPRIREMVLKDLASEARLAEAQRRETLMEEQLKRSKANQVIAATKRAARAYGVNYDTAEKVVALAVQANGGDLDVTEVDGLVQELTGLSRARAAAAAGARTVTPQKAAAVAAAPKGAVGGAGAAPVAVKPGTPAAAPAPAAQPGASAGLTDGSSRREGGGGIFRGLIKNINARIREA